MGSTFGGLNTALTSLYAQRRGLDVTGQNIANVNTPGYTRQRVVMQSQNTNLVPGIYTTSDGVGNGVTVTSVDRLRNAALDNRSFTEHANSAYHNERTAAYTLIEDVFGEPSDTALQGRLQDMWDGWNAVAANPSQKAPKSALLEKATTVAASLSDAAAALDRQYISTQSGLNTFVGEVNKTADAIAKLNKEIVVASNAGLYPNELKDQRGELVLKLAEMVGATASELPNGSMNVYIGNAQLVSEFNVREIALKTGATRLGDLDTVVDGEYLSVAVEWKDNKGPVNVGGTMGAQVEVLAKGGTLEAMVKRLDKIAATLASDVNLVHAGDGTVPYKGAYGMDGTSGQPFFVTSNNQPGVTAANIAVNPLLLADVNKLGISKGNPKAVPPVLDGAKAEALADLSDSRTGADADYQSLIGDLGVAAQSSIRRRDIQNVVTDQVDGARDAESGVNLDEEMTNLLIYQRGYEAASRVLTTIDSMLDQLINRTGLVGR